MTTKVFGDILSYLADHYPGFDSGDLLSDLLIAGVITHSDAATVRSKSTPNDRGLALFHQILPVKSSEFIRKCFDILRQHFGAENVVAFLNEQQRKLPDQAEAVDAAPLESAAQGRPITETLLRASRPKVKSTPAIRDLDHSRKDPQADDYAEDEAEEAAAKLSHTNEAYDQEIKSNRLDFKNVADVAPDLVIRVKHMSSDPFDAGPGGNRYYDNYSSFSVRRDPIQRGSHGIFAASKPSSGEKEPPKKGIALIINNEDYTNGDRRSGSHIDVQNISRLLEQLEYQIVVKPNLKARLIKQGVREFINENVRAHHKSCVLVIMAHGQKGKFEGTDGKLVEESEVLDIVMKSHALAGKPKIVIIQACRGGLTNAGMASRADGLCQSMLTGVKIPIGADTCILHSTMPGYFSWRNEERGSWFILALCKEFSEHAHKPWADLLCLATRVIERVSSTAITTEEWERVLQLPQVISNMRMKFHFFPGYEMPE